VVKKDSRGRGPVKGFGEGAEGNRGTLGVDFCHAREEVKGMGEEKVGEVAKYFAKVDVAGIQVEAGPLSLGDTIRIKGHTTDFTQKVESMQLDNQAIEKAMPGQLVGIKVKDRVREKDAVFKVVE